jgi:4-amino-4-deoxy-L-arabinose transferase-like glycosyltransferase
MPETLAALGGAAVVLVGLKAARSAALGQWVALGALIGASILARSEAVVLLPLLVLPLAWRVPGADARRRVVLAGAAIAVAVAVVLPWTVRNALTFHAFVPVSNNVGSVARGANCELAYTGQYRGLWVTSVGDANGLSSVDPQNRCFSGFPIRPGVNEAQAAAELRAQGMHFAFDHAGSVPGVMLARLGRTFGLYRFEQQTAFESLEGRNVTWERIGTREFQVLAILAVGGLVVLIRRRRSVWPLAAMVLAVIGTTMLTYGNQRFRASAEPAVILLASVAVVAVGEQLSRRLRPHNSTQ